MANDICFRTLHLDQPWSLASYRSVGGYEVLEKILRESSPLITKGDFDQS